MKNFIKKIKHFITKNKKFFFLGFFLFFFLVLYLFPYDDAVEKTVFKIFQSLPINIQYDSSSVGLFPPKISFKHIQISTPKLASPISSREIIVKPSYMALLAFKPGAKVQIHFGSSYLDLWFKKSFSSKKTADPIQLKIQSRKLEIKYLSFLSPFFIHSKGLLDFFLNLNIDLQHHIQPKGLFQFKAKNIQFQPYSFNKKYIGTISLPRLKWKSLSGEVNTTKGKIDFKNITIGEKTDSLYLQSKGFLNIAWKRANIKNYDLNLNLLIDSSLKSQITFIDLFLSNIEEKLSNDRIQYKVKITGQSFYPPKIQKLEK